MIDIGQPQKNYLFVIGASNSYHPTRLFLETVFKKKNKVGALQFN